MDLITVLGYIVIVSILISILYVVQLIRGTPKKNDLLHSIYEKSEIKVLDALKDHDYLTGSELLEVIKEKRKTILYGKYWSLIKDSKAFLQSVLVDMLQKELILEEELYGKKIYRIRNREMSMK